MLSKYLHQKGAILIMTALLLPMIICGTGLAVDLGNIYVQRFRLQNAADAAALAGAKAYASNKEKTNSHPQADATAKNYITGKYHNLSSNESIEPPKYSATPGKNITYYTVELSKKVPLYFLRAFYGSDTFTVPVKSIAAITYKSSPDSNNPFKNLFTFKDALDTINVVGGDDRIATTFDGRIVYTQDNATVKYDGNNNKVSHYYPAAVYGQKYDSQEAAKKGFTAQKQNLDIDAYAKKIQSSPRPSTVYSGNYWIRANSINQTSYYIKDAGEAVLDLSQNTTKISDKPINITIESASNPKIFLNNNSSNEAQPIILTYLGTNPLCFEGSGGSFYGIVYAPYAQVYCNDNNFKFYGSIVSQSIRLEARDARYEYKDYSRYIDLNSDSSSSGDSNNSTGSPEIALCG